jgi:hypothetical protein
MHLSFEIAFSSELSFVEHWSSKYEYPAEFKYTNNIGKPLTSHALQELFEWKNGSIISRQKTTSIMENYPLVFAGDLQDRYLNHKQSGGAIWNIFYLHCLAPKSWPLFDQHTFRAMRYIKTGKIVQIGSTNKQKYEAYLSEYIPFVSSFAEPNARKLDKALFAFGQFLKLAVRYA